MDPALKILSETALQDYQQRRELETAIGELPPTSNAAYNEAQRRCSNLVLSESNPQRFLRRHSMNYAAAARAMAAYWEQRCLLFGEKAYRPMAFDLKDVLSAHELDLLHDMKLPNDSDGRTVLYVDPLRCANVDERSKKRVFFCMLDRCAQQDKDDTGVVLVERVLPSSPLWLESDIYLPIVQVVALRVHALYFVTQSPSTDGLIDSVQRRVGLPFAHLSSVYQYHSSMGPPLAWIRECGLTEEDIPAAFGGRWGADPASDDAKVGCSVSLEANHVGERISRERATETGQNDESAAATEKCGDDLLAKMASKAISAYQALHNSLQTDQARIRGECRTRGLSPVVDNLFDPALSDAERALSLLESAMSRFDESKTNAFQEAKRDARRLVLTESDPRRYLVRWHSQVEEAAGRLADYWTLRRELFGERTFRPLVLDGNGAMDDEDIDALATGAVYLPPNDSSGRSVHYTARAPFREKGVSPKALLRAHFFVLSAMSENPTSQTHGFVTVRAMAGTVVPHALNKILEMLRTLPVRLSAAHFVVPLDGVPETLFRATVIPFMESRFRPKLGNVLNIYPWDSASGEPPPDLVQHLAKEALPATVGGSWRCTGNDFLRWIDQIRAQYQINAKLPSEGKTADEMEQGEMPDTIAKRVCIGFPLSPEEGLLLVEDELQCLDSLDTAALTEARDVALELIYTESDPRRFLRLANMRLNEAAKGLANYWTVRKKLFAERAFLPMKLDGSGAMAKDDITALGSGGVCALPNARTGVPATFSAREPFRDLPLSDLARLRAHFFVLSTVTDNDLSQSEGIIAIRMMSKTFMQQVEKGVPIMNVVRAFPLRLKVMYVVFRKEKNVSKHMLLESIVPVVLARMRPIFGDVLRPVIWEPSADKPPVELLEAGLTKEGLPTFLGGTAVYGMNLQGWYDDLKAANLAVNAIRSMPSTKKADGPAAAGTATTQNEAREDLRNSRNLAVGDTAIVDMRVKRTPTPVHWRPVVGDYALRIRSAPGESSHCAASSSSDDWKRKLVSDTSAEEKGEGDSHQVDDALTCIAPGEKRGLMQALKECPDRVVIETPVSRFYRCNGKNAANAATHLVAYWEKRAMLFGKRAYLAMSQTIEGTLNRGDVDLLSSGVLLLLPKNTTTGRSVFFFDSPKARHAARDQLQRVAFYLLHVASENMISQAEGLELLLPAENPQDLELVNVCLVNTLRVIPAKPAAVHVLCMRPRQLSPSQVQQMTTPLGGSGPHLHQVAFRRHIPNVLAPHGFTPDLLPIAIGGSWGVEHFSEWQELRTRYEWQLPPPALVPVSDLLFDFSTIKPLAELSKEERAERTRRLNKFHSRRKRQRDRVEQQVLEEQLDKWKGKNADLVQENERLQVLVDTALDIVRRQDGKC